MADSTLRSRAPHLTSVGLLADLATRVSAHDRPEEIVQDVFARVAEHLDVDLFVNYLVDEDEPDLRLTAFGGLTDEQARSLRALRFNETVCGTVAALRRPIVVDHVLESSDAVTAAVRAVGARVYACHPLLGGRGRLIGTVSFGSRQRDVFSADELELMQAVANQIAVAIERTRALAQARRELQERIDAERALCASEEKVRAREADSEREQAFLRTVLDSVSSMVMVRDGDGRCLLANEAAARFHGMTVGALEGRDCRELATVPAVSLEQDREALRIGRETTIEMEVDGADGHRHFLIVSRTPLVGANGVRDRVLVTCVDITWRKRAEQALRASEAKFRSVFEQAAIGIGRVRFSDARWIDVNDAFCRMLGRTRVEMLTTPWPEMTHPEDLEIDLVPFRRMAAGEIDSYMVEKRFVHKGGGLVWARLTLSVVLDRRGRPDYEVAIIEDVTERKRAEEALRESDRRKDEFIAILSHELRNPLAPIRYALPVLQRQRLAQPADRAIEVIDRQVDHLTRLVDDLLDVSRITRGKIELRPEHVTLDSVINAAVEAASPIIAAARHNLHLEVSDEPIWLYADAARIAQVVTNLLNNSAKYTPRGGRIAVEAGRENQHAVIRVRDNGIGIPGDALPAVFDMFRQIRRGDESQGGLGIGLALVKTLVEMHGGTIEARSGGAGQGAEFVVRLPLADGRTAATVRAAEQWPPSERKLKVLVVDDNTDLVEMLAMVVETAGHDVRKALDGRSAISAALSYRPDVVLLDLGLPVVGGLEVARELRRHREMAGVRLVALTGWGQAEDRQRTEEAGFDEHLTKPTDPQELQRLLARFAAQWS